MTATHRKSAKLAILGLSLALLAGCVDSEEENRRKKSALEAMSCGQLSTQAAVTREKIKNETEKATVSAIASAFTTGQKSDLNSINSSLSQIVRKDLEKELNEISIMMARKGCK